jgi:gliding motility-associated-like protein
LATLAGYVLSGLLLAIVPAYPVSSIQLGSGGFTLSVHTKGSTCGTANGSIQAAVAGGIPPYQFSIAGYATRQNGQFDQLPAGTYTLTVMDGAGLRIDTVLVLANQFSTPAVSIARSTNATGCLGKDGSVVLQAGGGTPPYTYAYQGAGFQDTSVFSNLLKGDYNFLVKDANGCGDSIHWFVGGNCNVGFTIGAFIVDAGCTNSGSVQADPQGGSPPFSFSLDDVDFRSSGVYGGLAPGRYVLYVKDSYGQENYASYPVYANCNLQVTAIATASDCQQISGAISATATAGAEPYQYSIDGVDFQPGGDFTGLQPGTYTVTVRDAAGNIRSTTATVTSSLIVNAGPPDTICQGGAAALSGFTNCPTFSWSPVAGLSGSQTLTPVASPDRTTTYYLIALSGSCRVTDSVRVNVKPPATVLAGADTTIAAGEPLSLTAVDMNHTGFDSWMWTPATGLDNPQAADPVLVLAHYGVYTYTVMAKAPGGCSAENSVTISVSGGPAIYVPNAFSPNGDGRNDVLKPIPVGIRTFQYFVIYSRSGQIMFYSTNPQKGWDGRTAGHDQPPGAFVWESAGIDKEGKTITGKGTVMLIR